MIALQSLMQFGIIGLITGITIALDGYSRNIIEHPIKEDGRLDKGRTMALYLSMLLFSGLSATFAGVVLDGLKTDSYILYPAVGLAGILGRDIVMLYANRAMKKAEESDDPWNK